MADASTCSNINNYKEIVLEEDLPFSVEQLDAIIEQNIGLSFESLGEQIQMIVGVDANL